MGGEKKQLLETALTSKLVSFSPPVQCIKMSWADFMLKPKSRPALCSGLWMGRQSLFFFSVPLINLSFWSSQGLHILGWYKCVWLSKLGIGLCSVLNVCGPIYLNFFKIVHTHHRQKLCLSVLWTLNYQEGWLQAFSCWVSASSS